MARNAVKQLEKFTQEILLHLPEKLHVYRCLTTAKSTQEADHHQITELVTGRIAPARILYTVKIDV